MKMNATRLLVAFAFLSAVCDALPVAEKVNDSGPESVHEHVAVNLKSETVVVSQAAEGSSASSEASERILVVDIIKLYHTVDDSGAVPVEQDILVDVAKNVAVFHMSGKDRGSDTAVVVDYGKSVTGVYDAEAKSCYLAQGVPTPIASATQLKDALDANAEQKSNTPIEETVFYRVSNDAPVQDASLFPDALKKACEGLFLLWMHPSERVQSVEDAGTGGETDVAESAGSVRRISSPDLWSESAVRPSFHPRITRSLKGSAAKPPPPAAKTPAAKSPPPAAKPPAAKPPAPKPAPPAPKTPASKPAPPAPKPAPPAPKPAPPAPKPAPPAAKPAPPAARLPAAKPPAAKPAPPSAKPAPPAAKPPAAKPPAAKPAPPAAKPPHPAPKPPAAKPLPAPKPPAAKPPPPAAKPLAPKPSPTAAKPPAAKPPAAIFPAAKPPAAILPAAKPPAIIFPAAKPPAYLPPYVIPLAAKPGMDVYVNPTISGGGYRAEVGVQKNQWQVYGYVGGPVQFARPPIGKPDNVGVGARFKFRRRRQAVDPNESIAIAGDVEVTEKSAKNDDEVSNGKSDEKGDKEVDGRNGGKENGNDGIARPADVPPSGCKFVCSNIDRRRVCIEKCE